MGLLILIEHADRAPRRQLVAALFRGLGDSRVRLRGHGLHGTLGSDEDLELDLATTCSLLGDVEHAVLSCIEGLDADVPVDVSWPDGVISTHMVHPVSDEQVARWRAAVSAALPVRWTTLEEVRAQLFERAKRDRRQLELFVAVANPTWLARARLTIDDARVRRALAIRPEPAAATSSDEDEEFEVDLPTRSPQLDVVTRAIATETTRELTNRELERARIEQRPVFARVLARIKGGWTVRVGIDLDGRMITKRGFLPRSAVADETSADLATAFVCAIKKASPLVVLPASVASVACPPAWVERLGADDDAERMMHEADRELALLCATPEGAAILDDLVRSHPDSELIRRAWCRCRPTEARAWLMGLPPGDQRAELVAHVRWPPEISSDPAFLHWALAPDRTRTVHHWALRRVSAAASDTPAWRAALAPFLADDGELESSCLAACCVASWGDPTAIKRVEVIAAGNGRSLARKLALEWLVQHAAADHVELFASLLDRGGEPLGGLEHRLLELPAEGLAAAGAADPSVCPRLFEIVACRTSGLEHALSQMVGLETMPETLREVEAANAYLSERIAGTPIHGQFRFIGGEGNYPLVGSWLHCTACEKQVGGALDFSGEVGPTDGIGVARSLIERLVEHGCAHAGAMNGTR